MKEIKWILWKSLKNIKTLEISRSLKISTETKGKHGNHINSKEISNHARSLENLNIKMHQTLQRSPTLNETKPENVGKQLTLLNLYLKLQSRVKGSLNNRVKKLKILKIQKKIRERNYLNGERN